MRSRPMCRHLAPLAFVLMAALPVGASAQALSGDRAFEPVVVTGAAIEPLAGATPERVAAFRYEGGAWEPVPVQVDEREEIDLAWVYNGRDNARCRTTSWCFERAPVFETVYMDEGTFVGPDSDAFVDEDDEVVFMARDAGARAPADTTAPPGVRGSHGVEVEVAVPGSAERGYVYLFWHDGRYPGDAGRPYVSYQFRLLSGDYQDTYNAKGIPFSISQPVGDAPGANPEDSEVTTSFYRIHFSDRWIEDELEVRTDGAEAVDLLDRWKILGEPGRCVRTEYTGSAGRGAFIANRSGPVRAIRSVVGFNSGPLMQQDLHFYEQYVSGSFFYRVHSLSQGPMAYRDYSPSVTGMRRYTNLDPEGLLLDGSPDEADGGALEWEVVQGRQGTLASAFDLTTDIPGVEAASYYTDEAPASVTQCTGDESLYGASGLLLLGAMPNTDPSLDGEVHALQFDRHHLYASPSLPFDSAQVFIAAVRDPLAVSAAPYAVRLGDDPDPPPGTDPPPEGPVFLATPRPNPSSGLARVTYWLAERTEVRLALYDLEGRRLAVVEEGRRDEGYHDVALPLERFPSGTYLVRLDTRLGGRTVKAVRR